MIDLDNYFIYAKDSKIALIIAVLPLLTQKPIKNTLFAGVNIP